MGFNCLFIFIPLMLPFVLPKLGKDLAVKSFPDVWKLLSLRLPSRDGTQSLPLLSLFCLLYFFLPPFEELGCFSGCLMSSAGIQKLFCGIYSTFKCSFDEFVGEKVFPVLLLRHLGSSSALHLFELRFSPGKCPGVGHMVTIFFVF